nr:hypothetical protein [Tanacetum cinerariifolium]
MFTVQKIYKDNIEANRAGILDISKDHTGTSTKAFCPGVETWKQNNNEKERVVLFFTVHGFTKTRLSSSSRGHLYKKNTLSQNDEDIEIDVDSVDIETLWELDRYVMNYRKNLSNNPVVSIPHAPNDKRADEQGPAPTPLNQGENKWDNASRSSSLSSSTSDSSSSDNWLFSINSSSGICRFR